VESHPAHWLIEAATADPHPEDGSADTRKQQAGDGVGSLQVRLPIDGITACRTAKGLNQLAVFDLSQEGF
jgi:hypothetical protein